jgi:thiol-disulfide isomerase/thioredoxin
LCDGESGECFADHAGYSSVRRCGPGGGSTATGGRGITGYGILVLQHLIETLALIAFRKRRCLILIILSFVAFLWCCTPAVSGSSITAERMSPGELKRLIASANSRYVIVVMAAWCGPCIKELPDLVKLFDKYRHKGLSMIGISIDSEGPNALQPFLDKYRVNFPVYWVGEKAVGELNIYGIPMIMLVKDGEIIEKIVGKRSRKFLDKKIRNFLKSG